MKHIGTWMKQIYNSQNHIVIGLYTMCTAYAISFFFFLLAFCFKVGCSHCILIPGAPQKLVLFWFQMKAHTFLIITLQIHNTLELTAENVPISAIPILIFVCIFMTASSSMSHSFFNPGEKISNLEVKLHKMS